MFLRIVLGLAGAGMLAAYGAWWAGALLGPGKAVARNSSQALVAASPLLGLGWVLFAVGPSWGPAVGLAFVCLVVFAVVLFAGADGSTRALVPPALRPIRSVTVLPIEEDTGFELVPFKRAGRTDRDDDWILPHSA